MQVILGLRHLMLAKLALTQKQVRKTEVYVRIIDIRLSSALLPYATVESG